MELEDELTMNELFETYDAMSTREQRQYKFFAAVMGAEMKDEDGPDNKLDITDVKDGKLNIGGRYMDIGAGFGYTVVEGEEP